MSHAFTTRGCDTQLKDSQYSTFADSRYPIFNLKSNLDTRLLFRRRTPVLVCFPAQRYHTGFRRKRYRIWTLQNAGCGFRKEAQITSHKSQIKKSQKKQQRQAVLTDGTDAVQPSLLCGGEGADYVQCLDKSRVQGILEMLTWSSSHRYRTVSQRDTLR